jgi:CDP-glycerol glycerophosphotransferase (TagB/SpsB family)
LSAQRKGQFSVYLSHGTTLKSLRNYYTIPNSIDYFLVTSENVVDLQAYEFNFDKTRIVPLGFPRNDVFSQIPIDIRPFLNTSCKKVIVWYPTYRQHKNGAVIAGGDSLPIIHNVEKAKSLNDVAKENDVLIVLKPHFAQDLSYVKDLGLSNIKFIGDDFFNDHGINSYCFVNGCDALITDYSSIYYDFTLCNKPVAVIWEDIEEYKKTPGLINDYEHYLRGAEKLFSLEDLQEFVIRVSKGEDALNKERNEVMKEVNISTDGKNSERVVTFIMNKIESLRK